MADHPAASDARLVIHTPLPADRRVLELVLSEEGLTAEVFADIECLGARPEDMVDAVIVSQEGLTPSSLKILEEHLAAQPAWSEVPVILLIDPKYHAPEVLAQLRSRLPRARLLILQRPVRRIEFATIVRSALAARRHQYAVRDHLAHEVELRHELSHRVKNVLATAQALFEMSYRASPDMPALGRDFRARLRALDLANSQLGGGWTDGVPLESLVRGVLEPAGAGDRIRIAGPEIRMATADCEILALVMHELMTNALKYGALSTAAGTVEITWSQDRGSAITVVWSEAGGPPVVPPTRRGYGTSFVERALRGRTGSAALDFAPTGLRAVLTLEPNGPAANPAPPRNPPPGGR